MDGTGKPGPKGKSGDQGMSGTSGIDGTSKIGAVDEDLRIEFQDFINVRLEEIITERIEERLNN